MLKPKATMATIALSLIICFPFKMKCKDPLSKVGHFLGNDVASRTRTLKVGGFYLVPPKEVIFLHS